jgi:hypothetical protein
MNLSIEAESNNHATIRLFRYLEKILWPQLLRVPAFGSINLKLVFHDGKLARIITNHEASVQVESCSMGFTGTQDPVNISLAKF